VIRNRRRRSPIVPVLKLVSLALCSMLGALTIAAPRVEAQDYCGIVICEDGVPTVAVEFFNPNDNSIYRGTGTLNTTYGTFYLTDVYTFEVDNGSGSEMTGTFEIPHDEYSDPIMDPDGNRIYQAINITIDGWDSSGGAWAPDGSLPVDGGGGCSSTEIMQDPNLTDCNGLGNGNGDTITLGPTLKPFDAFVAIDQNYFTAFKARVS
jgi:hypothetical protein